MPVPPVEPFRSSPFSLVADESSAACWAGRGQVLMQLKKLCRAWRNRADSTLDLVWANLGSGKTHALFHLRYLLAQEFRTEPGSIVVYAEIPDGENRFIEIYRRLLSTLPLERIAQLAADARPNSVSPHVVKACRLLRFGNDREKTVARDWITGGRPGLRDLKALAGIDSRIETDADADRVLSEILGLAAAGGIRVVVLLDEFQRVAHLGPRHRESMLSHVRSLFSRRSSHFSLVLAVGSRMEKTARELLPPELKTIMGMRPSISLPEMDQDEATEFLIQRLACYRPDGYAGAPEFPFTSRQIDFVISYLSTNGKARLIPRVLLQVFGMIYDEMSNVDFRTLSADELRSILEGMRWEE